MPPQVEVHSPESLEEGWPLEGPSGLETALLLARETPLPADVNLGKILGNIPPSPFRDPGEYAVRGYNKELTIAPIDVKRGLAKVAAKIDDKDRKYYEREVKPLFADPRVEFIGEIGEKDKGDFLGNAAALLFPVDWPEPVSFAGPFGEGEQGGQRHHEVCQPRR